MDDIGEIAVLFERQVGVVLASQEERIAARMRTIDRIRSRILKDKDYDGALRAHYVRGARHPDDVNIPLNKWDDVP